jgi:hypothetical protein
MAGDKKKKVNKEKEKVKETKKKVTNKKSEKKQEAPKRERPAIGTIELAEKLGTTPKNLRNFLRTNFEHLRSGEYTIWGWDKWTDPQLKEIIKAWNSREVGSKAKKETEVKKVKDTKDTTKDTKKKKVKEVEVKKEKPKKKKKKKSKDSE